MEEMTFLKNSKNIVLMILIKHCKIISDWKIWLIKKKKEEFNPNATSELPNLRKNNLLKNMIKEENKDEKGAEQNNT